MAKKLLFKLVDIGTRETICNIMVDPENFNAESGIIDFETMTCKHIANGTRFTIMPMEHHGTYILNKVRDVYQQVTGKPATSFSTMIGRMDTLIDAFTLLFTGTVEYYVVNNKKDMNALINPNKNYVPEKLEFKPIDDLLKAIEEVYGTIDTMVDSVNSTMKDKVDGQFVKVELKEDDEGDD